jgi:hypothetical protein
MNLQQIIKIEAKKFALVNRLPEQHVEKAMLIGVTLAATVQTNETKVNEALVQWAFKHQSAKYPC